MEVGVIGKGNLGKKLSNVYQSVDCDLLDENSIRNAVNGFDVVIYCPSLSMEWCEKNPTEAYELGVFGLERLLKVYNKKIIHISCDSFFNGALGFYSEEFNTFLPFVNRLAQIKYFQELQLQQRKIGNYLIIRTSELYDTETKNIKRLLNRINTDRPIAGATDIFFTPTYIPHLVHAVKELVERNLDGVINIAGKDFCNEEEFNGLFCRIYGYKHFYRAGLTDRNKYIRQPKRLGFDTTKAQNINIPIFSLEEGLSELCQQLKH